MKMFTFLTALILIGIGLAGYFAWEAVGAGSQSPTALIPAAIGALILLGGLIAAKNYRLGMMLAMIFGILGLLAGLGRLVPQIMKGGFSLGGSNLLVLIMTVVCLLFSIAALRPRKG